MSFLKKSSALALVAMAHVTLLAPHAQAQESKKSEKLLALGALVFMGATIVATHKNKKEIHNLRLEAMRDRRVFGEGLIKANTRLDAILKELRAGKKAGEETSVHRPDPPSTPSTREVLVQNSTGQEVFLKNIIDNVGDEKWEWPIPASGSVSVILKANIPIGKLFAVDRDNNPLSLDIIVHEGKGEIVIITAG